MTNNPKFAVGSNVPGYVPDSDPHHATWAECKGNYIFDSPRYPGWISTYGADKTNAHKEIAMSNQATGNSAHQPREGFMAPTFRIFVRTAECAEFQAFTWCRDEASGIARAWREGREFGHNVTAVWAEAV